MSARSVMLENRAVVQRSCAAVTLAGCITLSLLLYTPSPHAQPSGASAPLSLQAKIPLGNVAGRIDHLAVDPARHRLFIAELGNNSVGIIDLDSNKVVHHINALREPQGIAYVPLTDTVFVANGGDGSVRVYRGSDYVQVARINLGRDADNVRFDMRSGKVLAGFGGGGIAVVDATKNEMIGKTTLPAHPESFQIEPSSGRVFVNVPNASSIIELGADFKALQSWKVAYSGNFAMTLDPDQGRVIVAFRRPTRLVAYDTQTGHPALEIETCGDVDDLFYDSKHRRIYVICGTGTIDVLDVGSDKYSRMARLPTAIGARTGLFVPELNSLFVAVRGNRGEPPAIWRYMVGPSLH